MGPLLSLGSKRPLRLEDLNKLEQQFESKHTFQRFEQHWEEEQKKSK
jgi:hypothetical protein